MRVRSAEANVGRSSATPVSPVILLACGEGERGDAESAASLVAALWPGVRRPRVERVALAGAAEAAVRLEAGMCWVWRDDASGGREAEGCIDALRGRHVAVLLTTPQPPAETPDDVVAVTPRCDPRTACGILQSMWVQSRHLHHVKADATLLRQHHGGLRREMEKIDEELRLAAQLQRSFLPQAMPEVGAARFHTLWRPAGYVSGDIYDVFRLDEHRVGFFLADAVGHGVPAALMTMYIKRSLHTKTIDPQSAQGYRLLSPSAALQQLNEDMLAQSSARDRFATACYGIVDTHRLELTLARGGHPPPLLLRHGSGGVEPLSPEGGLLGVFPGEPFDEVTVALEPGDRVVLYSDGFEMALPDPSDAASVNPTQRRHLSRLIELRHGEAGDAMTQLERDLDHEAGSLNPEDDLTLILLNIGR